ncbi:MAG TPA: MATE family efflux transporter [Chitinophagaceae bacterium]|nr:MATE family efflux transporter [Chitinophagaceae bacterium]
MPTLSMASQPLHSSLQVQISNRQILKIALPISLAILVPQINFITNNIFLGHYSQQALAAGGLAGVYHLIFAMIGYGLNSGLQTLISRRAGQNRPEEIGRIFSQGVLLALMIAVIGILLSWLVAPSIFRAVIHDPVTAENTISFLKIRTCGLPFLYIYQMRNALLVGTNNSRYLVLGTFAETVANIFLDWLLIFGKWGFPEMGLNGAAVASIISEFIGMFVIFLVIQYKGITRKFALFKYFKWDIQYVRQITSISLPLIFQLAISLISWEFFYILIEHHGQTALAVSQVMRNIFGLVGCFTWAFAATSSSMVSNIIGQGRTEEVMRLIMKIVKLSTLIALGVALLINIFPGTLLSIFGQDQIFTETAIPVVRVVTLAMVLMAFSVIWLNAVTGTGNSRVTLLIEMATIILYCVYVYVVLEKMKLSITWGWMSEWLYWLSILLFSWIYMRSGKWKHKII